MALTELLFGIKPLTLQEHLEIVEPLNTIADKFGDPHGVKLYSENREKSKMPQVIVLEDVFSFYWELREGAATTGEIQYRPSKRAYRFEKDEVGELALYPSHNAQIWVVRDMLIYPDGESLNEKWAYDAANKLSEAEREGVRRLLGLVPSGHGGAVISQKPSDYNEIGRSLMTPGVLQATYVALRAQMAAAQKCMEQIAPIKEKFPQLVSERIHFFDSPPTSS